MESGFTSDSYAYSCSSWQPIYHKGSGRFEFYKVRLFGALHFVKRPAPRYAHDNLTTESLRKEFNIGYNLSHPSIVKYMRMECGAVFQEFIDGLSLRQMIDGNDARLKSRAFIRHICRQLLDATDYLHKNGVIHNDIKPENVMITRIGDQVKLVDLGCAYSNMWDTTEGFTYSYKAPEQGKSETNVYTDIFLVGKLMELLACHAGAADEWKAFVAKATSPNWKERYSTDNEAMAAIPVYRRVKGKRNKVSEYILWGIGVITFCISMMEDDVKSLFSNDTDSNAIPETTRLIDKNSDKQASKTPFDADINSGKAVIGQAVTEVKTDNYKVIERRIKNFTAREFRRRVFPKCKALAKLPPGQERDQYAEQIEIDVKSIIQEGIKIAVESARPYGDDDCYYYAIGCVKSSVEEQYDIALEYCASK